MVFCKSFDQRNQSLLVISLIQISLSLTLYLVWLATHMEGEWSKSKGRTMKWWGAAGWEAGKLTPETGTRAPCRDLSRLKRCNPWVEAKIQQEGGCGSEVQMKAGFVFVRLWGVASDQSNRSLFFTKRRTKNPPVCVRLCARPSKQARKKRDGHGTARGRGGKIETRLSVTWDAEKIKSLWPHSHLIVR